MPTKKTSSARQKSSKKTYYAVINSDVIFGVGTSPQTAVNDAIRECGADYAESQPHRAKDYPTYPTYVGEIFITQIPAAVYKYVIENGGGPDSIEFLEHYERSRR